MDPPRHQKPRKRNVRRFSHGKQEDAMKKSWKKPTMCQTPAGMEISRYLPAEITSRK
jgi:hypothetical protein